MSSAFSRSAIYSLGSLVLAALPTPAAAEPMSLQELLAVPMQQPAGPTIRPLFELDIDMREDERRRRRGRGFDFGQASTAPAGIIASVGRLGVAIDSSRSGRPRIRGLAWTPNPSLSVIAGGGLGQGGIGASLSVRLSF